MQSPTSTKTFYIGTRVHDPVIKKYGTVYAINVLGTNGLRVRFDDNTKKGYFNQQLENLVIIPQS